MIVLHGLWGETGFFVWGETDCDINRLRRRGRPRKVPGGVVHPLNAPIPVLVKAINSICLNNKWEKHIKIDKKWLIIPSDKYIPQRSPWLSGEEEQCEYKLGRWQIEGIMLPVSVFMESIALSYDENRMLESEGITVGYDWKYWVLCNQFLLRLLCSQKFIPCMEQNKDGKWEATWRPVLVEPDDRYIANKLIEKMPLICCSIMQDKDLPLDFSSPKEVFMDFLNKAVDQMVRQWLIDLPQVNDRAPVERKLLFSLHGEQRVLNASEDELIRLSQGLKKWTFPLTKAEESFRLCLQLHEPEEEGGDWYISFHLQSTDDPNLLVPASEIWKVRGDNAKFYGKVLKHPQEYFLRSLGQLLNLYPVLERALYCARPEGCRLSLDEAYLFLRQTSVTLYEQGIGVILPDWWKDRRKIGPRLKMIVKPVTEGNSRLGLDSLVKYEWKLAIGDQIMDYDEVKALAGMGQNLKKVGNYWIEINPQQINSILQWFDTNGRGGVFYLREALNMLIDRDEEELFFEINGEAWVDILLKGSAGKEPFTLLRQPQGFAGQLRPYQIRGYSWLFFLRNLGFGSCLADDMGLGKTIQVIAMLIYERQKLVIKEPTLIICPTSVVGNWQREIARFAPKLRAFIYHGDSKPSIDQFKEIIQNVDLVVTTYALIYREKEIFTSIRWAGIVLDEAQNIKNPHAKQTRAIKNLQGDYRIALTGTPIENRLRDLWSIMDFINPGYLRTWEWFRKEFSIPIEKYGDVQKAEQLKAYTQPFILRRLKKDSDIIRDLPEKQEMKVYCYLTAEQTALYNEVTEKLMKDLESLDGIKRKGKVMAILTKLKQICNHPSHFLDDGEYKVERSGKLTRLVEMLEEVLEEGDKALVFTQYAKMGRIIQSSLREHFKCEVLFLHGGLSQKIRENLIRRFQQKDGPSIFVLSLKAGGFGLNLTNANHVFHYDRWWNPAVENQATDRAFRIGQDKNVQVYTFICSGTLEEKIDLLVEQKKDLAERIIASGEGWLTELDNKALRELLVLF